MREWSAPSPRMAERVVVVLARPRVERESERVDAAVVVDVGAIGEEEVLFAEEFAEMETVARPRPHLGRISTASRPHLACTAGMAKPAPPTIEKDSA